jgi:hypothetical protein
MRGARPRKGALPLQEGAAETRLKLGVELPDIRRSQLVVQNVFVGSLKFSKISLSCNSREVELVPLTKLPPVDNAQAAETVSSEPVREQKAKLSERKK